MEPIDKISLRCQQFFIFAVADGRHDVEILACQIAISAQQGGLIDVATTFFGHVSEHAGVHALIVCPGDEIDHAADGIGPINCRRPIFQDVDALHSGNRQLVDINRATIDPVGCNTAAIQQDQGAGRALATQVGKGTTASTPVFCHVGVRGKVVDPRNVRRQIGDQLFRAGDAFALEVFTADNLQRQRTGLYLTTDARPGHNDGFDRFGLCRRYGCSSLCKGRTCQAGHQTHLCPIAKFHGVLS